MPARTLLEKELTLLWTKALNGHPEAINIRDDFLSSGGTLLLKADLLKQINEKFNLNLSIDLIKPFSIENIASAIVRAKTIDTVDPRFALKRLKDNKKNSPKPPLFILPSATGNGPTEYAKLAADLNIEQEVYTATAPGLIDPMLNCCDLDVLSDYYCKLIMNKQPKGPYYLAGWSSGSVLAYLIALKLELRDHDVNYLALIDQIAPPKKINPVSFAQQLLTFASHLPARFTQPVCLEDIQTKSPEEQVTFIFARLQADPEKDDVILQVASASLYAYINHIAHNKFGRLTQTQIHVLFASDTFNAYKHGANNRYTLGWTSYGATIIRESEEEGEQPGLLGDHFSIIREPKDLSKTMTDQLNSATRAYGKSKVSDTNAASHSHESNISNERSLALNRRVDELIAQQVQTNQLLLLLLSRVPPQTDTLTATLEPLIQGSGYQLTHVSTGTSSNTGSAAQVSGIIPHPSSDPYNKINDPSTFPNLK